MVAEDGLPVGVVLQRAVRSRDGFVSQESEIDENCWHTQRREPPGECDPIRELVVRIALNVHSSVVAPEVGTGLRNSFGDLGVILCRVGRAIRTLALPQ